MSELVLLGAVVSAFLPYLSPYLVQVLGAGGLVVGLSFALFSLARLGGGLVADRVLALLARSPTLRRWRLPVLVSLLAGLLWLCDMVSLAPFVIVGSVLALGLTVTTWPWSPAPLGPPVLGWPGGSA